MTTGGRISFADLPREEQWRRRIRQGLDFLDRLSKIEPLHGAKWRQKMADYYAKLLHELFTNAPKGCEDECEKYVKDALKLLDKLNP